MRLRLLGLVVAAILPVSVLAERYGSETALTLQGTYYLVGSITTKTLNNGDTVDTATHTVVQISNATILQAMKSRGLIPSVAGYQLVMVGHAHMADGVSWFAAKSTGTPVAIPSDLFSLYVSDGPTSGPLTIDSNAALKSLNQQTHNLAYISQGDFTGSTVLSQTWKSKSVKNGTVTEGVELVTSAGTFTGDITSSTTSGVGSLVLNLTGAKIVDLTRYGMATTTTSTYGGSSSSASATSTSCTTLVGAGSLTVSPTSILNSGATIVSSGTLNLSVFNSSASATSAGLTKTGADSLTLAGTTTYTGSTSFSAGTFQLVGLEGHLINGGTHNLSSVAFSSTGTLTINATQGGGLTDLAIDLDGNVTHLPTFGTSLPATLVIITSSGTHTYTHDSNGVWTLVAP